MSINPSRPALGLRRLPLLRAAASLLGLALLASCGAESKRAEPIANVGDAPIDAPSSEATTASTEVAPTAQVTAEPTASAEPAAAPPPWAIDQEGQRIGSISFRTWIWSEPMRSRKHLAIGALRVGSSVKMKTGEPVPGQGCNNKWYEIEPHGFICSDVTTTFEFDTPYWKALASLRPGKGSYPFEYAFSMGAPMYSRIPTKAEWESAEREMGPVKRFYTLGKWSEGHEALVTTKEEEFFKADGKGIPEWYDGNKGIPGSPWNPTMPKVKNIPAGSGFAYARAFEAEGRLWLQTPDLFVIPADRVWPYKKSDFKGVALDEENTLPLAWVKPAGGKEKLKKDGDAYAKTDGRYEGRKPVYLTGKNERKGKIVYWETKGGDYIADDDDVTVVLPKTELKFNIKADEKWLDASILGGTMTAFVGLKPVYTTLWSPGLGGVPVKGNDPKKFATTEVGVFPIQWKDKVELMSPDPGAPTVFWFADVPWIQYVHAPMAMHVSYWHENFGYPMSAECLNTSAQDGEFFFNFTNPKLPEGWGSVGAGRQNGPSTKINITP